MRNHTTGNSIWKREAAIHTLGNLTIVTDRLNRSLSNLAFKEKKPKLIEHSNLTLNHRIAEREDLGRVGHSWAWGNTSDAGVHDLANAYVLH